MKRFLHSHQQISRVNKSIVTQRLDKLLEIIVGSAQVSGLSTDKCQVQDVKLLLGQSFHGKTKDLNIEKSCVDDFYVDSVNLCSKFSDLFKMSKSCLILSHGKC